MKPGTRETFAYGLATDGGHNIPFAPQKEGLSCTAWSCKDLFEEYEQAMRLLGKIASGDSDDPIEEAEAFFKEKKEGIYNYYDPEEEGDEQ